MISLHFFVSIAKNLGNAIFTRATNDETYSLDIACDRLNLLTSIGHNNKNILVVGSPTIKMVTPSHASIGLWYLIFILYDFIPHGSSQTFPPNSIKQLYFHFIDMSTNTITIQHKFDKTTRLLSLHWHDYNPCILETYLITQPTTFIV